LDQDHLRCRESDGLHYGGGPVPRELHSLFSSFHYGDANQLAFFPAELRTPIMHAGRSQTLLRMTYDGVERLVELYSLGFKWRKGGTGQEYFYVWDQTGGRSSGLDIKSLFNWKSTSLENTDIKFEPRFEIGLAKAGEYGERTTFSSSRRSGVRRSTRARLSPQARYRVRCAYCQREFDRTSPSTVMRPHQDGYGNPCSGRRGLPNLSDDPGTDGSLSHTQSATPYCFSHR
jgi:hypothetical protein